MSTATWSAIPPQKSTHARYVKYVPVGYSDTHSTFMGYLFWIIGFTGCHRFFFGKPVSGVIWFFTFGLLGIGWLIDAFLIPSMSREADYRFQAGRTDYNLAWVLLVFGGVFGIHRFYQERWGTAILYLLTGGLLGIGVIYDVFTMNDQINDQHCQAVGYG